jgi:hypothetical protein
MIRRLFMVSALAVCATLLGGRVVHEVRAQQVGTVVPGTAAIWTDQHQYDIGDAVQICWRIPIAGQVTITDLPADGTSMVIFDQVMSTDHGCINGTITPPSGRECLQLSYPLFGGQGQTQTCFTVLGGPNPPPSQLAIYLDQSSYSIGSPYDVCYRVPAPGPVRIVSQIGTFTPINVLNGYDDGTGGCIPGVIPAGTGTRCWTIQFTYTGDGGTATAQACAQVS